jgi:hypothetical protein
MLAKGIVKNMEKGNCNPEMHLTTESRSMPGEISAEKLKHCIDREHEPTGLVSTGDNFGEMNPSSHVSKDGAEREGPEIDLSATDEMFKRKFLRKRNAMYSKRNYYRKKNEFKDLENWSFELRAENFDLKQENKRLEAILAMAQEKVLRHLGSFRLGEVPGLPPRRNPGPSTLPFLGLSSGLQERPFAAPFFDYMHMPRGLLRGSARSRPFLDPTILPIGNLPSAHLPPARSVPFDGNDRSSLGTPFQLHSPLLPSFSEMQCIHSLGQPFRASSSPSTYAGTPSDKYIRSLVLMNSLNNQH